MLINFTLILVETLNEECFSFMCDADMQLLQKNFSINIKLRIKQKIQ